MLSDWPFYFFALLALTGASGVLFLKNVMHSAFSLMFCLISLAGLYIYAGAEFLGVTQLLVYVGGIVVLLIFGIMLSQVKKEEQQFSRVAIAVIITIIFSYLLIYLIYNLRWADPIPAETSLNHVHEIGKSFFVKHLLAFEIAGILLLIALIGAIGISGKNK